MEEFQFSLEYGINDWWIFLSLVASAATILAAFSIAWVSEVMYLGQESKLTFPLGMIAASMIGIFAFVPAYTFELDSAQDQRDKQQITNALDEYLKDQELTAVDKLALNRLADEASHFQKNFSYEENLSTGIIELVTTSEDDGIAILTWTEND